MNFPSIPAQHGIEGLMNWTSARRLFLQKEYWPVLPANCQFRLIGSTTLINNKAQAL
jgi:hypothetical protein